MLAVFHRLQRRRLGQPLTVLDFYSAVRIGSVHGSADAHLSPLSPLCIAKCFKQTNSIAEADPGAMQKYTAMKDGIVKMERVMLREFGFIVHVDHPHKLVLNHVNLLHKDVRETALKTRLMQEAFSLTNDRSALPQPVQEHPLLRHESACSAHIILRTCTDCCRLHVCTDVSCCDSWASDAADASLLSLHVYLQTTVSSSPPFEFFLL